MRPRAPLTPAVLETWQNTPNPRLVTLAVRADGRRVPDALTAAEAVSALDGKWPAHWEPVLDHAGPSTALHDKARPVGPSTAVHVPTGRQPRALTPDEWTTLHAELLTAARALRAAGAPCITWAWDQDGLWHAARSPLWVADAARAAYMDAMTAVLHTLCTDGKTAVALTVEDLAPGGLSPTEGVADAQAAAAAGATCLYASGGTTAFAAMVHRPLPAPSAHHAPVDSGDAWLASPAWLVGRVPCAVWGQTCSDPSPHTDARAAALGLAGLVLCSADDARAE